MGDRPVLHRHAPGTYRLDLDGEPYRVERITDGTLSSAVIWELRREWDRALLAEFTTLADLRGWVADRHKPPTERIDDSRPNAASERNA